MFLSLPPEVRGIILSFLTTHQTLRPADPSRQDIIVVSHQVPVAVLCSCRQINRDVVELWRLCLSIAIFTDDVGLQRTLDAFVRLGWRDAVRTVRVFVRPALATPASTSHWVRQVEAATTTLVALPMLRSFWITVERRSDDIKSDHAAEAVSWTGAIAVTSLTRAFDRWEGCEVLAGEVLLPFQSAFHDARGRVRVLLRPQRGRGTWELT